MTKLTKKEDWDKNYLHSAKIVELGFGWRDHVNNVISRRIEGLDLADKNVLEIGAGDSQWLPYLAKKYPNGQFSGLDYSEAGCQRLVERTAAICGEAAINVYKQDMFSPDESLKGRFDLVMSFGVAEHFTELSDALIAKRQYIKDQGYIFTLIPNMSGAIGDLTKSLNAAIYKMHNPHNLNSFLDGHIKAGLKVIDAGYLGSINFGMLSSCVDPKSGLAWHTYVFLSRLTKATWFLESKCFDIPTSSYFSPYIFAISKSN
jgi:2-polyprenyl-3-methyl-5-hydroxy-6-metoxy-1,4-benzoquinol methylase